MIYDRIAISNTVAGEGRGIRVEEESPLWVLMGRGGERRENKKSPLISLMAGGGAKIE